MTKDKSNRINSSFSSVFVVLTGSQHAPSKQDLCRFLWPKERPGQHIRIECRVLLLAIAQTAHGEVERSVVPGDKDEVSDRQLPAHEPAAVLGLRKYAVEHREDADSLLLVPLDRRRKLLLVETHEPKRLAKVGARRSHDARARWVNNE